MTKHTDGEAARIMAARARTLREMPAVAVFRIPGAPWLTVPVPAKPGRGLPRGRVMAHEPAVSAYGFTVTVTTSAGLDGALLVFIDGPYGDDARERFELPDGDAEGSHPPE